MKKTKFMRAALLLLVLTLITSCFVGGTFAKYTTNAKGSNQARVAKFGVTITGDEKADGYNGLFAHEYEKNPNSDLNSQYSVVSSVAVGGRDSNVFAPGTSGEMSTVAISGTPEVAVNVKRTAYVAFGFYPDGSTDATPSWNVDGEFYCPLVFTIKVSGNQDVVVDGKACSTQKEFIDKFTNAINLDKNYAVGDDIASSLDVSWEWPFEGDDVKDTKLAGYTWNNPMITINISATVTQID